MRARTLIATLAAAGALAGCGGDGPRTGDTEKVRTTVETLLRLCAEENGPGVADLLADDTRRRFLDAGGVLEGCDEVMRLLPAREVPGTQLFAKARVTRVQRNGDHATALVTAGRHEAELRLLDSGLRWYVENPPLYEPAGVESFS